MSKRVFLAVVLSFFFILTGYVAQAQTASSSVEQDRTRAMELYEQNNFKEAMPLLESLAEQFPKDIVVQERLGMCILGNAAHMVDQEQRRQERLRARKVLLHAKELGDDSNMIQVLLEQVPEDGSAGAFSDNKEIEQIMRDAEAAFTKGDMKGAIDGYVKAIILDPNLYTAALFAGDAYYKQKLPGSAGEWFARAIQIDPNVETAYRYWGDALMSQGKMDDARMKFIEAVVAEPYRKASWIGLQQWANANNVKLTQPEVKQQTSFSESSPTQMNIIIDADALKKKDGSNAWMFYGISRAAWHGDKFKKEFPNEKQYRHTLREEADSLEMVADMVAKDVKDKKIKTKNVEPGLATLMKLNEAGLLEAYVLISRPDQGIAQDYAGYRREHRDKLRQYLDEFVVPMAPTK
jgi:tetratricopeptide (TPR) repeat protein